VPRARVSWSIHFKNYQFMRHQWDSNQWHLNAWTQWAFPPVGDGEEHRTPMLIYIYCAHHVFYCLNIDFVWSTNTINISIIVSIIYICIPVSGCVCRGPIALLWLEAYNAVIRRPWFELTTLVVVIPCHERVWAEVYILRTINLWSS
jgi:hypothetical protein